MLSGAWLIKSPEVRFFPVPLRQLIELVENVVLIRLVGAAVRFT